MDEELTPEEIENYIANCINEYTALLNKILAIIAKDNAPVTARKLKRLKKSALFKMMKIQTGKA